MSADYSTLAQIAAIGAARNSQAAERAGAVERAAERSRRTIGGPRRELPPSVRPPFTNAPDAKASSEKSK